MPLVPKPSGPWGRTSCACLSPTQQSSPPPIIPCSWVTKEKPEDEEDCQGSPSPSWGAESFQIADKTMHNPRSMQIVPRMEGKTPKDLMSTLLWMRKTRSREQGFTQGYLVKHQGWSKTLGLLIFGVHFLVMAHKPFKQGSYRQVTPVPGLWLELLGIRHFLSPEVAQLIRRNLRYCETHLCHQLDRGYLKIKPKEP